MNLRLPRQICMILIAQALVLFHKMKIDLWMNSLTARKTKLLVAILLHPKTTDLSIRYHSNCLQKDSFDYLMLKLQNLFPWHEFGTSSWSQGLKICLQVSTCRGRLADCRSDLSQCKFERSDLQLSWIYCTGPKIGLRNVGSRAFSCVHVFASAGPDISMLSTKKFAQDAGWSTRWFCFYNRKSNLNHGFVFQSKVKSKPWFCFPIETQI